MGLLFWSRYLFSDANFDLVSPPDEDPPVKFIRDSRLGYCIVIAGGAESLAKQDLSPLSE
jgi:hypothetical protein